MLIYFLGKEIKIDLVSPESIFPCLDSFDLLITTPNLSNTNNTRLIRVYISFELQNYIDKLIYIREYKVPKNNLLKIECQFFSANYNYYCFVYVTISHINGAIIFTGKPYCLPTIKQTNNESIGSNEVTNKEKLMKNENLHPAGPSYNFRNEDNLINYGNNEKFIMNSDDYQDNLNDNNSAKLNIKCHCNGLNKIDSNETTVIVILDILRCNNLKKKRFKDNHHSSNRSHKVNYEILSTTICLLNLTNIGYHAKVSIEKAGFPVIYVSTTTLPHLIVRDGRLPIDPQLDISKHSLSHSLKTQYLRIESSYSTNIKLKLLLLKSTQTQIDQPNIFLQFSPIHYTSILLILFIVFGLVILLFIALLTPKRKTVVQITTPTEEVQTAMSYFDHSSLSQFSLGDNDSLEMDYYDYFLLFVPHSQSGNINTSKIGKEIEEEND